MSGRLAAIRIRAVQPDAVFGSLDHHIGADDERGATWLGCSVPTAIPPVDQRPWVATPPNPSGSPSNRVAASVSSSTG